MSVWIKILLWVVGVPCAIYVGLYLVEMLRWMWKNR